MTWVSYKLQTDWRSISSLTPFFCIWKEKIMSKVPAKENHPDIRHILSHNKNGKRERYQMHGTTLYIISHWVCMSKIWKEKATFFFFNLNNGIICLHWTVEIKHGSTTIFMHWMRNKRVKGKKFCLECLGRCTYSINGYRQIFKYRTAFEDWELPTSFTI